MWKRVDPYHLTSVNHRSLYSGWTCYYSWLLALPCKYLPPDLEHLEMTRPSILWPIWNLGCWQPWRCETLAWGKSLRNPKDYQPTMIDKRGNYRQGQCADRNQVRHCMDMGCNSCRLQALALSTWTPFVWRNHTDERLQLWWLVFRPCCIFSYLYEEERDRVIEWERGEDNNMRISYPKGSINSHHIPT